MKRTIPKDRILMCALLGVMVAGPAMAANLRYQLSGDYFDTLAVTGDHGWQAGGGGPDGLPGTADTARVNWANNLVTLTNVAPLIKNFQLGVDQDGRLEVDAGGLLQATAGSFVGNNNNCTGQLIVNTGGEVDVTNWLQVGAGTSAATATYGILTINGGTVRLTSHLWVGSYAPGIGTVYITNGGSLYVGGNIGLGTLNANTPSGGKGSVFVGEGGLLSLHQISAANSIQPGSVLDISGSGVVTIPNDVTAVISDYTNAQKITAYSGAGTVGIDYDTNAALTTLFAIAPAVPPPTDVVWNPAANFPDTNGLWNVGANWTGGVVPGSVTEVEFNIPDAIPCTVTNVALAGYLDMGNTNVGGKLIIANGGSLNCGAANWSVIGDSYNAVMEVENGGSASFGYQLIIGSFTGAEGKLIMNGGTVSVTDQIYLGYLGGTGIAQINGGTLRLSKFDDYYALQGNSVLDVTGTGVVVIAGNHQGMLEYYVSTGQVTNSGGGTVMVDYNNINAGATTLYPSGIYLPPVQETWNPALNPETDGMWSNPTNWSGGLLPGNITTVTINVAGSVPCIVSNEVVAGVVRIDQSGGGTLIITNGGSLTCSASDWCGDGYNQTGNVIDVEDGGSFSCASHLWVGFNTGGSGTLIMNGGTVSVGGMFGLGWSGGTGTAQINGGTLNLRQWSTGNPGSIAGASVLDVSGTGKVVITGNYVASISNYVSTGQITANGGSTVFYGYYPASNTTVISATLLPPPPQSITAISVSGGSVSITYQTSPQQTYYVEGSPSLSPASWTPVAGSTNTATGDPVTFTFPASGGQMFYRTVSP